jgi:hypothetical protein
MNSHLHPVGLQLGLGSPFGHSQYFPPAQFMRTFRIDPPAALDGLDQE